MDSKLVGRYSMLFVISPVAASVRPERRLIDMQWLSAILSPLFSRK